MFTLSMIKQAGKYSIFVVDVFFDNDQGGIVLNWGRRSSEIVVSIESAINHKPG